MRFPPIKAGRGLLWIMLRPDAGAAERYAALHAILKSCRLHPLDTTAAVEVVIVEADAVHQRIADLVAVLGPEDVLHLATSAQDRLTLEVIAGPAYAGEAAPDRLPEHLPPWLRR